MNVGGQLATVRAAAKSQLPSKVAGNCEVWWSVGGQPATVRIGGQLATARAGGQLATMRAGGPLAAVRVGGQLFHIASF